MPRYDHILYVCNNAGSASDTKARCGKSGADELLARLKACVVASGRKGRVRITRSGCLDFCNKGCAVAAYSKVAGQEAPVETWYTRLRPEDAEELFAAHIERGERYTPAGAAKAELP